MATGIDVDWGPFRRLLSGEQAEHVIHEIVEAVTLSVELDIRSMAPEAKFKAQGEDHNLDLHIGGLTAEELEGRGPWDLKVGLHGRPYLRIPFKHSAPGSKIRTPLGARPDPRAISSNVWKAMGGRPGGVFSTDQERLWGLTPHGRLTPEWTTSRYSRMQHNKPEYGKGFVTFRTMKADQVGKWIHPGFKGRRVLDEAVNAVSDVRIESATDEAIDRALDRAMKKLE